MGFDMINVKTIFTNCSIHTSGHCWGNSRGGNPTTRTPSKGRIPKQVGWKMVSDIDGYMY